MKESILEDWILFQLKVMRHHSCLLPSKSFKKYGEKKILAELQKHGITAVIVERVNYVDDMKSIYINQNGIKNFRMRTTKDITYYIEQT